MDETRTHFTNAGHGLHGPHRKRPAPPPSDFTPLLLLLVQENRLIPVETPSLTIGRHSQVELRLTYPDVSRRHCRLACRDGCWRLSDLGSLNGVYLNDERIVDAPVYEGDRIRVGDALLIVQRGPRPAGDLLKNIHDALPRTAA
jgi:pSer/pThr/pTyr-binding forkhead associated (FHA) protein